MTAEAGNLIKDIELEKRLSAEKILAENFSILKELLENGASGTFISADGTPKTVTVTKGIITDIT